MNRVYPLKRRFLSNFGSYLRIYRISCLKSKKYSKFESLIFLFDFSTIIQVLLFGRCVVIMIMDVFPPKTCFWPDFIPLNGDLYTIFGRKWAFNNKILSTSELEDGIESPPSRARLNNEKGKENFRKSFYDEDQQWTISPTFPKTCSFNNQKNHLYSSMKIFDVFKPYFRVRIWMWKIIEILFACRSEKRISHWNFGFYSRILIRLYWLMNFVIN